MVSSISFCLHTAKLFQVLTFIFCQHYSFVCTLLNSFKYSKWLNSSIWLVEETLTGTIIPGPSKPRGNGNEGVFHISQSSTTGTSPSDGFVSYPGHSLGWRVLPLSRDVAAYLTAPAVWVLSEVSPHCLLT